MRTAAIVDLGTNTFHLMIVQIRRDGYQVLHKERVPVRIGMNGISHGVITDDAIDRACNTLSDFKSTIDKHEVNSVHVFGTSAIRNAANGAQFVKTIKDQVGFDIHVIDGKYESELILKGVRLALEIDSVSMVVDIGGGSVEFIICNSTDILWNHSFEIGAQRLLDQFHRNDPITDAEVTELERFFDTSLQLLADAIHLYQPEMLIGSSGTFDTLSEIYCAKNGISVREDQKELPLTIEGYGTIHKELLSKNKAERLLIPGMVEMRVDMIVVASCMVSWIINRFGFDKIRVSTYALKEGVLYVLLNDEE